MVNFLIKICSCFFFSDEIHSNEDNPLIKKDSFMKRCIVKELKITFFFLLMSTQTILSENILVLGGSYFICRQSSVFIYIKCQK
jgi:hypothetical protein